MTDEPEVDLTAIGVKMLIAGRTIGAESCASCRALWERGPNLFCRRYPPTVNVILQQDQQMIAGVMRPVMQKMIESQYPPTQRDHWCGEWMPRST